MLEYPDKDASRQLMRPDRGLDDSGAPLAEQFFGGALSVDTAAPQRQQGGGQDIFGVLWARKWSIMCICVLLSAMAIPPLWLFLVPKFRATAVVRISPIVQRVAFTTEENKGVVPRYANYVNTQVSIIKSPKVLRRVLDSHEVQETKWFASDADSAAVAEQVMLEKLMKGLTVKERRGTEMVDISFLWTNPAEASTIVDAIAEEYKQLCDEEERLQSKHTTETLEHELVVIGQEIDGLLQQKYNIAQQIGAVGSDDVLGDMGRQMRGLEEELRNLEIEHDLNAWEFERLGGEEVDGDAKSYSADPEWRGLQLEHDNQRHELEVASQQYGRSHPRIKAMRTKIEHAERMLRQRENQLDGQVPGTGSALPAMGLADAGTVTPSPILPLDRQSIRHHLDRNKMHRDLLENAIEQQGDRVKTTATVAHDIARLEERIRRTREAEELMQARLQALEVESKAPARISISSMSIPPSSPYRDRRIIFSLLGVLGAMGVGCGFAYLRGVTDQKIRAIGDVQGAVSVPFLGQLPELPRSMDPVTEGGAMLGESIRMVRTALLERLQGRNRQVILVTSSTSQVGKTSVSILLSKSMAQLGKRVLLVEGDLRAPTVSQRLVGFESKLGLAALLCGEAKDEQVILPTDTPRFDVLAAGHRPMAFDFEKLANGVFSKCLARWKKTYDLILVDSPPVLPVADTRILAGQVDGAVMVLRSSHCARPDVIQAYADLSAAGGTLLGTILIGGQPRTSYGYGYGYGDDREVPQLENLADVDRKDRRLLES